MRFAITGHGRSGTNWLSQLMNQSNIMTVEHEPINGKYIDYSSYFDSKGDNYGQVNNRLRWHFLDLPVDRYGVILRHPLDIYYSMLYRKHDEESWTSFMHSFYLLDHIIERAMFNKLFLLIRFNEITQEKDKCQEVLDFFGCSDVKADLTPTNHKNRKYQGWDKHIADIDKLQWFVDKYNIKRDTDRK